MTFVFLIFRNNTRGRITRSSKIEGLKSMMGCPKQEGVSRVKGNGSRAEGENKRGKKLSLGILLSRISSVSSSECSLRFRNSCLENLCYCYCFFSIPRNLFFLPRSTSLMSSLSFHFRSRKFSSPDLFLSFSFFRNHLFP